MPASSISLGHSITYRIALGPQQGRKVFTLQTVPAVAAEDNNSTAAKPAVFSLHAGVASEPHQREKLERLGPYITRRAVSTERLSLTTQGHVRYRLKPPYRDGTTDVDEECTNERCHEIGSWRRTIAVRDGSHYRHGIGGGAQHEAREAAGHDGSGVANLASLPSSSVMSARAMTITSNRLSNYRATSPNALISSPSRAGLSSETYSHGMLIEAGLP